MKIKRDYSQPFFRQPKRHRLRNRLIAALLVCCLAWASFHNGQLSVKLSIRWALRKPRRRRIPANWRGAPPPSCKPVTSKPQKR